MLERLGPVVRNIECWNCVITFTCTPGGRYNVWGLFYTVTESKEVFFDNAILLLSERQAFKRNQSDSTGIQVLRTHDGALVKNNNNNKKRCHQEGFYSNISIRVFEAPLVCLVDGFVCLLIIITPFPTPTEPATRSPNYNMRESSFAFPAQNRACVCISSQLYDRRGIYLSYPF